MEQYNFSTGSIAQMVGAFADMVADKVLMRISEREEEAEPRTYTRQDVCRLLQVTTQTIGEYIKQGKLTPMPCVKGRGQLFDARQVDCAIGTGVIRKGKRTIN